MRWVTPSQSLTTEAVRRRLFSSVRLSLDECPLTIVYSSRLSYKKGLRVVESSASSIRHARREWANAARGRAKSAVSARAEAISPQERVCALGAALLGVSWVSSCFVRVLCRLSACIVRYGRGIVTAAGRRTAGAAAGRRGAARTRGGAAPRHRGRHETSPMPVNELLSDFGFAQAELAYSSSLLASSTLTSCCLRW